MTFRVGAIRNAVKAVLEGRLGAVRTVPIGMFQYGTFDGQNAVATQARAMDIRYAHRFDITIGSNKLHASTPVSNLSSYRNAEVPITIDITTALQNKVQDDKRDEVRAMIASDADTAMQALAYRNNLNADETGTPTSIISGLLKGAFGAHPEWESVSEDWTTHIHRSRITAAAIVQIGQNTL